MERDLLKARLAKLPQEAPIQHGQEAAMNEDEAEELDELDSFPAEMANLSNLNPHARRMSRNQNLAPLSASAYFEDALQVDIALDGHAAPAQFRVYYTAPNPHAKLNSGAVLASIAADPLGSGPAKAPWAISEVQEEADDGDDNTRSGANGIVFVCAHGAGYSGLSYACLAKAVKEQSAGKVGVLAYDARGHGKTYLPDEPSTSSRREPHEVDMSLKAMSEDLVRLLKATFPDAAKRPSLLLIGHSMGGAVVANACNVLAADFNIAGLTMIDIVEGSALEALPGMMSIINSHPSHFPTVEAGISWHLSSRTLNNSESARVSVPSLLKKAEGKDEYVWRTHLAGSEPYWIGWFTDLSQKFISSRTAKLLILAGTDRLDKDLMIAQMQGKFQVSVIPEAGHSVQEDTPDKAAQILLDFWKRNDRSDILKGVKKVGQV